MGSDRAFFQIGSKSWQWASWQNDKFIMRPFIFNPTIPKDGPTLLLISGFYQHDCL